MASFADIVTPITIANFALGAWDGLAKNNPMVKVMKDQGDWEYDQGGDTISEVLEAGRILPQISAPGMDLTAALVAKQRYARVTHVWGEIAGCTVVDLGTIRRNSGPQALVRIRDKEIPAMLRDTLVATDGVLHQFLRQNIAAPTQAVGTVTGLPMAGLPSFLLAPAATDLRGRASTGVVTGSAVAAGDAEAVPGTGSQTYGTLSMAPVGSNGAGTGGLTGIDGLEPDAYTPTLVNTTSTFWNGSASASANVLLWSQWLANRCRRFSGDLDKRPDPMFSAWMDYSFFQFLGNAIAAKQTIYLQGKGKNSADITNAPTGTDDMALPHAGMLWRWEERMPASCAYIIPWRQVRFKVQPLFAGIEGNGNPLAKSGEDAGIIETAITYDGVKRQWDVTGTVPMQYYTGSPRFFGRAGAYA